MTGNAQKSSVLGPPGREALLAIHLSSRKAMLGNYPPIKNRKKKRNKEATPSPTRDKKVRTEWVRMTCVNCPVTTAKLTSKINAMPAVIDSALSSLQLVTWARQLISFVLILI